VASQKKKNSVPLLPLPAPAPAPVAEPCSLQPLKRAGEGNPSRRRCPSHPLLLDLNSYGRREVEIRYGSGLISSTGKKPFLVWIPPLGLLNCGEQSNPNRLLSPSVGSELLFFVWSVDPKSISFSRSPFQSLFAAASPLSSAPSLLTRIGEFPLQRRPPVAGSPLLDGCPAQNSPGNRGCFLLSRVCAFMCGELVPDSACCHPCKRVLLHRRYLYHPSRSMNSAVFLTLASGGQSFRSLCA
jgi:hypothetical protein